MRKNDQRNRPSGGTILVASLVLPILSSCGGGGGGDAGGGTPAPLVTNNLRAVGLTSGDRIQLGDTVKLQIIDSSIVRRTVYGRRLMRPRQPTKKERRQLRQEAARAGRVRRSRTTRSGKRGRRR